MLEERQEYQAMFRYTSRRSPVYGLKCMVSTSQPLASRIGLEVLRSGGNAVDSAIAIAAALNVTEPCSTGLGGDCFMLYYEKATNKVHALNGSGRCPSELSLHKAKVEAGRLKLETPIVLCSLKSLVDTAQRAGVSAESLDAVPQLDAHAVTVPGSAAGWCDALEAWGTQKLDSVLAPAIELAEKGFPVGPITAELWKSQAFQLKQNEHGDELLIGGEAPLAGEVFQNENLGKVLRTLAEGGKSAFYEGFPGRSMCEAVQSAGGCLGLSDLKNHTSSFEEPISATYRDDYEVFEVSPNGQGITTLLALNLLEGIDVGSMEHGSPEHLHALIEFMRLAFADTRYYVADPSKASVPVKGLLSKEYAAARRKLFDPESASSEVVKGSPLSSSDTVSFQVVDTFGNAVSMVNSNYTGFGTGIVPKGCGFSLQSRGANFSLIEGTPNALAPNKRPYHTIIPAMAFKNGTFYASFTVMGGFMQPQGQMQVFSNLVDFNMDPQAALDASRFCIFDGTGNGKVAFEDGIKEFVVKELRKLGHAILEPSVLPYETNNDSILVQGVAREIFGRGQIITINQQTGVLTAGSDGRADGCAMGY